MARRATSLSKKETPAGKTAPAKMPEPATAKTSRRGKQAKSPDMPTSDVSVADAFFPGGEEVASVSDLGSSEPVKARRGRKSQSQPAAKSLTTEDAPAHEVSSPAIDTEADQSDKSPDLASDTVTAPAASPAAPQSSAAHWDSATGAATFDWPSIEQVAAAGGPNQGMAKLLLAARAEGANSRWPF